MERVFFLICMLLFFETSVATLEILHPGRNLELQAQLEKLTVEKIKVLPESEDKENNNTTDRDISYIDAITNAGFEEDDDDEQDEEEVDFVDEELEQRDRDMMIDAIGGESDVDANHGSFFGSLRIEANKKACKYQCNKRCYNPHQQQCCKNNIVRRPWRCCAHSCGKVCYDQKTKQCCNGKVILKSQHCAGCANRCGRACFDPKKQKCCTGRVVLKNTPCCRRGFNPCGQRCFNPRNQKCCHGKVTPKNFRVCGRTCYNPHTHHCCRGRVVSRRVPCCRRRFNPCGQRCFNPRHQKCCHGKVTPKNFRVCGRRCYNPHTHHCCRGRVIPRRLPCCYRCGGLCIDPRLYRCCHQRQISKHIPCISGHGAPLRITQGLNARRVGCFKDTWNRAIPSLETKSYILIGNYQKRPFAIEKCALAAARLGWSVFALQDQGWCASSPTAGRTYNKYGRSNTCRNGKGGPWGNDVYVLEGKARRGTMSGDICVFPFIYKGRLYNGCTRVDHNHPWCAITPNYDVDKLWGNC